jgi:hypothetical protein
MANRPQCDNYQRFARTAHPPVTVTLLWREPADHTDDQKVEQARDDRAGDPQRDRHNDQQQKQRHLAPSDLPGVSGVRDAVRHQAGSSGRSA